MNASTANGSIYGGKPLACAVANYLGNHGVVWAAVAILIGLVVYVLVVLKVRLPKA